MCDIFIARFVNILVAWTFYKFSFACSLVREEYEQGKKIYSVAVYKGNGRDIYVA